MQLPTNPYTASPVAFLVKKEKRIALLEWEKSLTSFERRQVIRKVSRAINAWYYQEGQWAR